MEHQNETSPHRFMQHSSIYVSILSSTITTLIILALVSGNGNAIPFSKKKDATTGLPSIASPLTQNTTDGGELIPNIVDRVTPAVVSVIITADVPITQQYFEDYNPFGDFFGDDFGFQIPREVQRGTEKREIGGGTGFFVSSDGYLITNRHVVETEGADFSIITNDGETYDVDVIAKDPMLDVAVLKVQSDETFPYLEFGEDKDVRLGGTVIAVGNALAEFPNSVSVGVISGLSRNIVAGDGRGFSEELEGVIQTDAAINQGNSGGPLLNLEGKVIGVNVAVAGNSENIGFALPVDIIKSVYEGVKEHGEIVRPFVGIRYQQIDAGMQKQNDLSVDYGILVIRGESRGELAVIPGSPADKAGIEENDIILEVDGVKLDGSRSFANIIRGYEVGETVSLKLLHDGEEKTVTVILDRARDN